MIALRAAAAGLGAALCSILPLLAGHHALADEVRLHDGEVLYGEVEPAGAGWILVRGRDTARKIARREVAEIVTGAAPWRALADATARLAAEDAAGRVELARAAWHVRLDETAARLLQEAVTIDPDSRAARRLRAEVAEGSGWGPGWPAPWPPVASVGPRWGAARQRALRAVGGESAHAAAHRALDWLATHQSQDGRIDADGFPAHCPPGDRCTGEGGGHHGERVPSGFDGAATAAAVLAWSAGGSTTVSGPHREALRRAVPYLVEVVRRGPRGFDEIWNHALAVEALADVACVGRDPAVRDVVADGVGQLEALQLADGGWSYVYGIGDVPTTSIVLQTLGLAAQVGVGVEPQRVRRALAFLDARIDTSSGRSEYHEGAGEKGYTPTRANAASALAARAALGRIEEAPHRAKQEAAITERAPRWKISFEEVRTPDGRTVRAQVGSLDPLTWYHACFALERGGRALRWRRQLVRALADGQRTEGHAAGSFDPLGQYMGAGGRPFVTALAALMLLAPCRYAEAP